MPAARNAAGSNEAAAGVAALTDTGSSAITNPMHSEKISAINATASAMRSSREYGTLPSRIHA